MAVASLAYTPRGYSGGMSTSSKAKELDVMANTTEYQVDGMTCGHCEGAVRAEVRKVEGVTAVEVSAQTGRLVVTAEQPVDDDAVIAAVDEAGYAAVRS